jgi:hypothetical protein
LRTGELDAFEVHFEPFLQLADLGSEEVLIAWGGFYFRRGDSYTAKAGPRWIQGSSIAFRSARTPS